MGLILGISGRKQAGKESCCRFLIRNAHELFDWGSEECKMYSFAGPIKRFCIDVLGLTREQCYGSNEQKNTLTRFQWEDLPHYSLLEQAHALCHECPPRGLMTARQILQEVGTGIFRRLWQDVWAEACVRQIQRESPRLALVEDVRFPNEVRILQREGGRVVRLTRAPFREDEHESEKALDHFSAFDGVIDNDQMTPLEQYKGLQDILVRWGWARPALEMTPYQFRISVEDDGEY